MSIETSNTNFRTDRKVLDLHYYDDLIISQIEDTKAKIAEIHKEKNILKNNEDIKLKEDDIEDNFTSLFGVKNPKSEKDKKNLLLIKITNDSIQHMQKYNHLLKNIWDELNIIQKTITINSSNIKTNNDNIHISHRSYKESQSKINTKATDNNEEKNKKILTVCDVFDDSDSIIINESDDEELSEKIIDNKLKTYKFYQMTNTLNLLMKEDYSFGMKENLNMINIHTLERKFQIVSLRNIKDSNRNNKGHQHKQKLSKNNININDSFYQEDKKVEQMLEKDRICKCQIF